MTKSEKRILTQELKTMQAVQAPFGWKS